MDFKNKNFWVGLFVITLIIAGIFYARGRKGEEKIEATPMPSEETIFQEIEGTVEKKGEETKLMTEEEERRIREEIDAILAEEAEEAKLLDVSGGSALGNVKRRLKEGKYYLKIIAQNLPFLEKGFYYEGFLEKDGEFFSVRRMMIDTEGNGTLYYKTSEDKSDFKKVIVTLEPEDGNPAPARHILEGEF